MVLGGESNAQMFVSIKWVFMTCIVVCNDRWVGDKQKNTFPTSTQIQPGILGCLPHSIKLIRYMLLESVDLAAADINGLFL